MKLECDHGIFVKSTKHSISFSADINYFVLTDLTLRTFLAVEVVLAIPRTLDFFTIGRDLVLVVPAP